MRARAVLATELDVRADGRERTRVATMRSEAPLMLRSTLPKGPEPWTEGDASAARVSIAAAAAGPIGGDRLALEVAVGAASTLVLGDVSATLLLPGPSGAQSRFEVHVRVGAGATLVWLPEPVIAARDCSHLSDVRVDLEPGARLLLREELLLGRHGERPGSVRQRLRVRLDGRPLHHQELVIGEGAPGWDGPAVTGSHRAIGSLLVVDPEWGDDTPPATPLEGDAALMPLSGPAVVVSALSEDSLALRRSLDGGFGLLASPSAASSATSQPSRQASSPAAPVPTV